LLDQENSVPGIVPDQSAARINEEVLLEPGKPQEQNQIPDNPQDISPSLIKPVVFAHLSFKIPQQTELAEPSMNSLNAFSYLAITIGRNNLC